MQVHLSRRRCKIQNVVQCHDKLFIPKFNGLQKTHVNHCKVKFAHLWYMLGIFHKFKKSTC
jgi:hypothetical protein